MKNTNFIFALIVMVLFYSGCQKNDLKPKVDANGLTEDITKIVPENILEEMKRLGMPINGGANPPKIENTYLASPFILINSNRPGDLIGRLFSDYKVTFSNQDNDKLKLSVDYENGSESGNGIASFIVGDDKKFSVFVTIDATYLGTNAKLVHVISGKMEDKGIRDLYFANFMVDDYGDPKNIWIDKGEGRVIKDDDGFSPIQ